MRLIWDDVDPDQKLWRYYKTERFVQLLESSSLHFAAARQFSDRFEGAVAVMPPGFPVDPRYTERPSAEDAFEQLRRLSKISCWHHADHESDAMWRLYADLHKGIAICTTPNRLAAGMTKFRLKPEYGREDVFVGNVRYVDLLKERLRVNSLERFFHKHLAFSWEQEFRMLITLEKAEMFTGSVPEKGVDVQIDLGTVVSEIYLGPELGKQEQDSVRSAVDKCGLGRTVQLSCLLGEPRYL